MSTRTFDVTNPATGEVLATLPDHGPEEAMTALRAAADLQASWAATPPRERAEILRRAFDLVIERTDEFAATMTAEMGKPLAEARGEVTYGAEFLRWFSEEAVRIGGETFTTGNGRTRILTTRRPIGPCVLITPWNFPLAMGTRKIGPALAAGCTAVVKPSELTPLTMIKLAEVLAEAGLPEGVLSVITTTDAGAVVEPMLTSGLARKVSFTGSTGVGRTLLAQAAEHVLASSMELGGNAPFIVCEDADVEQAVKGAVQAKMRNMGEACVAANRFLVHESVAEEFSAKLAEKLSAMTVGNGADEGVEVGPLIEQKALDKVVALVDDAVSRGARVLCGGSALSGPGHFHEPTVLVDVPADAEIATTEVFGPVAPVTTFTVVDDAIARANDTPYGLAGYLYCGDADRALALAERLEVGMVGLNVGMVSDAVAPFGGVKESGLGREGSTVGIEEYLETQYVAMRR